MSPPESQEALRQARRDSFKRLCHVAIGFGVGGAVGALLFYVGSVAFLKTIVMPVCQALSVLYISALIMPLVPLIVSGIWLAVYGRKNTGKLLIVAGICFAITTLMALSIGTILAAVMKPGEGLDLIQAASGEANWWAASIGWVTAFAKKWIVNLHLYPNFLGLILLTMFMALAGKRVIKTFVRWKCKPMLASIDDQLAKIYDTTSGIMENVQGVSVAWMQFFLGFLPYAVGVFAIVLIGRQGLSVLIGDAGRVIFTCVLGLIIHQTLLLCVMILAFRKRALYYWKIMWGAPVTAFATRSSMATLPISEALALQAGLEKKVTSSVLPLGATVNMDGTSIYVCVVVVAFLQAIGAPITAMTLLTIGGTVLTLSVATAAAPSASLALIPKATIGVLASIGLGEKYTEEQILQMLTFFFSLDVALDMFRTQTNVFGDCCVTFITNEVGRKLDLLYDEDTPLLEPLMEKEDAEESATAEPESPDTLEPQSAAAASDGRPPESSEPVENE